MDDIKQEKIMIIIESVGINIEKKKVTKNKGLFDHITHITQRQTKDYWDSK